MSLKNQRRLAASLLGSGESRIWIDPEETTRVESAITRQEIKSLIDSGRIRLLQKKGVSRHLRFLRDKRQLAPVSYKLLLGMSKGGAFRSRSHVDEYVKAHELQRKR
ncbi:hypothetical protein E6H18_01045 [Candidatus Bathyarchaeota archaeon]|nr:MAG: hypothetical protein E6H18_01045 [Candidatus Bathyarchaeota archaeon]